jgi:hypothetical protein
MTSKENKRTGERHFIKLSASPLSASEAVTERWRIF